MIDQAVREYIARHRLNRECLFEDWEAFLDFLYGKGGRIKAVLFYENRDGIYEQTRIMMNGLERKKIESLKKLIRSVLDEHAYQKLLPCFYLYDKEMPDLKDYDDKTVRITDFLGDVYEGNAVYFSDEYAWEELGRFEEGLQLVCYLFYYDQIKSIESLEKHEGPYGKFSAPFGKLEEDCADDPDLIDEFLWSEDKEHIERMLKCLEAYLDPQSGKQIPERERTLQLIGDFARTTDNEALRKQAEEILRTEAERKQ